MRRSTIEILRDILALGRCTTNEAIYRVGLNPPQFGRYRTLLLQGGFIRTIPPQNGRRFKAYEPTARGMELRKRIDRVLELLAIFRSTSSHRDDSSPRGSSAHSRRRGIPQRAPSTGR